MKEVKDLSVLVFDNGLFLPIAERMARDVKRVLYHTPWEEGFSTINKDVIGFGLKNVERCRDIWPIKYEVDLWCFPDVQHAGLQIELEMQGKAVWGSRSADRLELNRELFLRTLEEVGLQVPPHKICIGVTQLRDYLRDHENCYVKISRYRGSLETKHWRSWKLDENLIDLWAVRFGAVRELIRFLVFDAIDTPLEIGCDTYNVDGQWPELSLHGIECKDTAYFAAVTKRAEMPEQVQSVMERFAPVLGRERYRNEFSMEIRVKGDNFYFIDPTCRGGLPSTGSQLELWENYSQIIWSGAHGELVQPIPTAKFSAELILNAKIEDHLWATVEVPTELRQWVKLADCCEVDGVHSWPREEGHSDCVGWLVAIGDTPTETLDSMKEHVAMLPDGLTVDIAPLAEVIAEIELEERQGIEFTEQAMPEPSEVIKDA